MLVLSRILAVALFVFGTSLHALSLGEAELRSFLNQPLRVDVPLRDVTPQDLGSIRVRVAPESRYTQMGLRRDDYLRNLTLEVVDAPRGAMVRITGEGPLREPFIDLLLEVSLAGQNMQRQFTLLLDPPEMTATAPAAPPAAETARQRPSAAVPLAEERPPAVQAEAAPVPPPAAEPRADDVLPAPVARDAPAETEQPRRPVPVVQAAAAPAPSQPRPRPMTAQETEAFFTAPQERQLDPQLLRAITADARPQPAARPATTAAASPEPAPRSAQQGVYTVAAGETLWRVAFNTRPDTDVTMDQMMLAIAKANPDAFVDGSATALARGARLTIPARDAAVATNSADATQRMAALTSGRLRTTQLGAAQPSRPSAPVEAAAPEAPEAAEADARAVADAAPASEAATESDVAESDIAEVETEADPVAAPSAPSAAALADELLAAAADEAEAEVPSDTMETAQPAPVQDEDEDAVALGMAETDPGTAEIAAGEGAPSDTRSIAPVAPLADSGPGFPLRTLLLIAGVLFLAAAVLLALRRRRHAAQAEEDFPDLLTAGAPATETNAAEQEAELSAAEEEFDRLSESDDARAFDPAMSDDSGASAATGAGLVAGLADSDDEDTASAESAVSSNDEILADADFRISYGLFDDAEARLKRAISTSPDDATLRVKLAEVYAAAERQPEFLDAAEAAIASGVDAEQQQRLDQLAKQFAAASPGSDVDDPPRANAEDSDAAPVTEDDNLLAFDLGDDQSTSSEAAESDVTEPEESASPVDAASDEEPALDFDFDVAPDADKATALPGSGEQPDASDIQELDDNALDFSLEDFDAELTSSDDDALAAAVDDSLPREGDDDTFDLGDFDAELTEETLPESEPQAPNQVADEGTSEPATEGDAFALDATDDALDLGDASTADGAGDTDIIGARLDLARAYVEMGESEMASPLLQEIIAQGDEAQRSEAQRLLSELG